MKRTVTNSGFTLIEIFVSISIGAVIMGILFSVFITSKRKAMAGQCLSNMHQLNSALLLYKADYDGVFPLAFSGSDHVAMEDTIWLDLCKPYLKSKSLECPMKGYIDSTIRQELGTGYSFNYFLNRNLLVDTDKKHGKEESVIDDFSSVVTIYEAKPGMICGLMPDIPKAIYIAGINNLFIFAPGNTNGGIRHFSGGNYAFADGHVKWYHPQAFQHKVNEPGPRFWVAQ